MHIHSQPLMHFHYHHPLRHVARQTGGYIDSTVQQELGAKLIENNNDEQRRTKKRQRIASVFHRVVAPGLHRDVVAVI